MSFRSIFGAFFFIMLASFTALVIVVQTKSFGRLATRIITDISQKKAETKVSIKNLEISVFPPGIELRKVKISKDFSPDKKLQIEVGKLGFYFNFIEFEEKSLSFGEVRLNDSFINFTYPESNEEVKEIDQRIIQEIFKITEKPLLRMDTLVIENADIVANRQIVEAKRLKVFRKKDSLVTRFNFANLRPLKDSPVSVDEIWGHAVIGKENLRIHRLKVQHDTHSLIMRGEVEKYRLLKNAKFKFNGEGILMLKSLENTFRLPEMMSFQKGVAHLQFNASMSDELLNGKTNIVIDDLRSNLAYADQIKAALEFKDQKIVIKSGELHFKKQSVELTRESVVFDLEKNEPFVEPIQAKVANLDLNNVLRFLGPSLRPLKGELNGIVDFRYRNKDLFFTPKDHFIVRNLGLVVGEDEKPFEVLMVKNAKLTGATFSVVKEDLRILSFVELNDSKIKVQGHINKKNLHFEAKDAEVDLEDLGNISQLDIKGKGKLDVIVTGTPQDAEILINANTNDFEVLGYKLGMAQKKIKVDLKEDEVVISDFNSTFRNTNISGQGFINYGNSDISLEIKSDRSNFHDLKDILDPISLQIDFLPKDLYFDSKISALINGKTKKDQLRVKSSMTFNNLTAYGEDLERGRVSINFEDDTVYISDFNAEKAKGFIEGNFSIKLSKKIMDLAFSWASIPVASFNFNKVIGLNLNGKLSGTVKGSGPTGAYRLNLNSKIQDTRAQDYRFDDSNINLQILPNRIKGKLNFLGKILDGNVDYFFDESKRSSISITSDIDKIKPLATVLFGQTIDSETVEGKINFTLDTKFRHGFKDVDLRGLISQLTFKHENFNVNYSAKSAQFLIIKDEIRKWNFNVSEPDINISTWGEGRINQNVSLNHELQFNSKILEILLAPVLSSEGFIRSSIKIDGKKNNYDFSILSNTQNLDLSLEAVPFPLNKMTYDIEYSQDRLLIRKLTAALDNGNASVRGDVFFDKNEPDINIKYVLDKAEIPILGKSSVNISGEGTILGSETPYVLGGEIVINRAQILNELSDFNSKSGSMGQVRFLPKNQESPIGRLLLLNLNVKADNLVRITNSLMDIGLKGEIVLTGNPARPQGEGRLFSPMNASRVFFKNSEYVITTGDLNFSSKKELTNPDFDVQASTNITNYRINAKAYGDLGRMSFDLTSDPPLPRNSILSLIAFGYTDEIQSTLQQKDQQSLTQVGVGSFVFDRFKISDILNKQFGLQVNLGTVFEQRDSLLTGRNQEGQSTLGRTRSATKIELKKRLDEALTLSVSSTMGGSIGQRQSMNLNYGINKNVQLEGVYEVRTNPEGEEDILNNNSIGGDLKFRWTFK